MPGGRPSSYKPEYCDTIVELMRDGASIEEVAADIGCCIRHMVAQQTE